MPSKDHQYLMKTLNKLVKQERWRKIPKAKGKVIEKGLTKSGNIKLVIKSGKKDIVFYVLKKNKNIFETASQINVGENISVAMRTHLGKHYCVKLSRSDDKQLDEWVTTT